MAVGVVAGVKEMEVEEMDTKTTITDVLITTTTISMMGEEGR